MSLVPLWFSNWWGEFRLHHCLFNQDFGEGLYPSQLFTPFEQRIRHPSIYYQSWGETLRENDVCKSTITLDKDKFQIILVVQQFKPEEIDVNVIDKNFVVEGKHEEKKDEYSYISRHFTQSYMIPDQYDSNQTSVNWLSNGVFSITVPIKNVPMVENERNIQIIHTGKPVIAQSFKVSKEQENKNINQKVED